MKSESLIKLVAHSRSAINGLLVIVTFFLRNFCIFTIKQIRTNRKQSGRDRGSRIRKDPWVGIWTRDTWSVTVLFVCALPIRRSIFFLLRKCFSPLLTVVLYMFLQRPPWVHVREFVFGMWPWMQDPEWDPKLPRAGMSQHVNVSHINSIISYACSHLLKLGIWTNP